MTTPINEILNSATQREDDNLWITFDDSLNPISLHVGPEPEFSDDGGLVQINLHTMSLAKADFPANLIVAVFDEGGDAR